jgi:hypothetical protein
MKMPQLKWLGADMQEYSGSKFTKHSFLCILLHLSVTIPATKHMKPLSRGSGFKSHCMSAYLRRIRVSSVYPSGWVFKGEQQKLLSLVQIPPTDERLNDFSSSLIFRLTAITHTERAGVTVTI